MNSKVIIFGVIGLGAGLLAACHESHHAEAPKPPAATTQSLDTAQVLALAQKTSETSAPIAVNGGALTINDSSETSAPIAVSN